MGDMPEIWFPNLGIQIKELSNVAFSIFGIDVYWYGVIIGTGIILSLFLALYEAKRTNQNPENYMDFTMIAIVVCVICARLYYVIFSWDYYSQHLSEIFAIRNGGLAIYGGIIGGVLTAYFYTKAKKLNFWLFADTAAPSLLLGQIIGRWGNFFNREAFGGYTDGLFAMRYMKDQVSNISQSVLDKVVNINGVEYIQVQPTFLYESFWNLCVFIILMVLKRKKKFDGEIFGLYIIGYALGRVWIEGLRTDQLIIGSTGIPVSQLLSAFLIVVGIVIIYLRNKKTKTI
ncbi:prolipoprotein diacylglyceryl transferase [Tyzzerella sp. An114]|uniref:prolipoprotein diacylglyceryl transferase n=1 Tax=Tyzzerella sp. An114 TaxID=1965545 RepID=UPI000B42D1D6|nr:prolipoprotein diacylglyceryl transferase [Tyzzerella sp. An114]OUQ59960.1 prolipoprotein diacylglyceryl transferase [Tyzzerella sp. An114]HIT73139.1 prolipoprotein diacylglyceryl transferase [Candidatus Fimicola cottocaccae]